MPKNRLLSTAAAALLGAAALGAAPGAAGAAQTVGSDLNAAPTGRATCGPAGPQAPCTYALDSRGGGFEVYVEPGHVITRWWASLEPGSQARLRLLRRTADRTGFTAVGAGPVVTGSGGVESFPVHLRAPESGMTIGVELLSGSIGVAPSDLLGFAAFAPPLGDGETRAPSATAGGDLLLAATAEPDLDGDDRADESEDDCVFCRSDGGGGGDNGGGGDSGGGGGGSNGGGGGDGGGSSGDEGDRPIGKPSVTIEPRAILRSGVAGQKGYIEVYVRNPNTYDVSGWIQVKLGKTLLGRGELDIEREDDHSWGLFRLPRREVARLLRKGRLKVTAIASVRAVVGPTAKIRRTITVLRGGAAGYDGTYRGPGPVVIVVERGAVFAVSYPLNLFCAKSKRFRQMPFHALGGFPTLVKKDGSFSAKGSESSDSITYRGKLNRNGTGRGYLSLFHTELWVDGGGLQSDTCFDARRWTVKRDR